MRGWRRHREPHHRGSGATPFDQPLDQPARRRSALDADGNIWAGALVFLSLSPFPPFIGAYVGQTLAAGGYLLGAVLTLLGAAVGVLVSVGFILASGVLPEIKAHEIREAIRRLHQRDQPDQPDPPRGPTWWL